MSNLGGVRPLVGLGVWLLALSALACSSTGSSGASSGSASTGSTNGTSTGAGSGASSTGSGTGGAPGFDGGTRFPSTSVIYQDISSANLDPNSDATIGALADAGGWGTPGTHKFQVDFGLTTLYADPSVPALPFTPSRSFESADCDVTPVPLPPGGSAEGASNYQCNVGAGDCHVLVYQGHWLYEMWQATTGNGLADGGLTCTCEVAWDLRHDYWQEGASPYSRGEQCTSADAAGMPIASLLVTGAELQAGVVRHALRFTLPNAEITSGLYLHPGTHAGAPSGAAPLPIYGARFRLKQSFDLSRLPNAAAKAIAVALQTYGMFLDDGGNIPLTIDASAAALLGSHDLAALQVSDFEVVASPAAPVPLTDKCHRTPLTTVD